MTRAQLKEEALKLPEEDRRDLLEALHESLGSDEDLPAWQKRLLDERIEEIEREPDAWVSREEAERVLRAKLSA